MSRDLAKGFLADIVANPDDDTPRLVYADWLEDQGDEDGAEFIRVQIERARLPKWDAAQVRLRIREAALLKSHGKAWTAELPRIKGVTWGGFRRGFVAEAKLAGWVAFHEAGWRGAAPVEAVSLKWPGKGEGLERIAAAPGVREMAVTGRLVSIYDAARLSAAPLLAGLRVLNVSRAEMGIEAFRRIMESPHLGGLKALRAGDNSLGNGAISAICSAPSLEALEVLDLGNEESYGSYGEDDAIDAEGMRELAAWPGLAGLRRLVLTRSNIEEHGLRALLRSPHSAGLRELGLYGNGLHGGRAAAAFKQARPAMRLDVLNLTWNMIEDKGLKALEGSPCLGELKVLSLECCGRDEYLSRRLASAPFLPTLRWLNAEMTGINGGWVKALLDARPPMLHTLWLSGNAIDDNGVKAIARSPGAASLLDLDLAYNEIDDEGVEALGCRRTWAACSCCGSAATTATTRH